MISSPISSLLPDPVEVKPKCKRLKKIREKENLSSQDYSSNPSVPPPAPAQVPVSKRTRSPGVRVVGGRIYDSERGKTCHQCRQKTMDFSAACKILRQDTKPCTLNFCHKCLLNRYGEKAEEVEQSDNWQCPKCRGICNCSFCMKKRGHQPTGILVHTAKATGFNSVSAMLLVNPTAEVDTSLEKEQSIVSTTKERESASTIGKVDSSSEIQLLNPSSETKKRKKSTKSKCNDNISEGGKDDGDQKKRSKKSKLCKENMLDPFKRKDTTVDCKNSQIGYLEEKRMEFIEKEENMTASFNSSITSHDNTENTDSAKVNTKAVNLKEFRAECKREFDIDIPPPLPLGIELTTVAGVDLAAEDVGDALQLIEFCNAFEQILDVKQGQAEAVLQELTGGCSRRRGQYSSLVQLQIQLLSFIRKDIGVESPLSSTSSGNSWLQALEKCISESEHTLKDFPLDFFDRDGDGYEKLEPSKKLRLLNFLCDETLCTTNMRVWIDKQNLKLLKRQKVAKEKVFEAKDKERQAKQKMQDEVAKAVLSKNGAPLSISEHEGLVSHIKAEVAKAHAKKLEAMEMVPKRFSASEEKGNVEELPVVEMSLCYNIGFDKYYRATLHRVLLELEKQRSNAVRTEPVYLDGDDHIFWRLKGYSSEPNILLQDIRNLDSDKPEDKWFRCDVEQKTAIDKYISSARKKRHVNVLPQGLDTLATLAVAMEEESRS